MPAWTLRTAFLRKSLTIPTLGFLPSTTSSFLPSSLSQSRHCCDGHGRCFRCDLRCESPAIFFFCSGSLARTSPDVLSFAHRPPSFFRSQSLQTVTPSLAELIIEKHKGEFVRRSERGSLVVARSFYLASPFADPPSSCYNHCPGNEFSGLNQFCEVKPSPTSLEENVEVRGSPRRSLIWPSSSSPRSPPLQRRSQEMRSHLPRACYNSYRRRSVLRA